MSPQRQRSPALWGPANTLWLILLLPAWAHSATPANQVAQATPESANPADSETKIGPRDPAQAKPKGSTPSLDGPGHQPGNDGARPADAKKGAGDSPPIRPQGEDTLRRDQDPMSTDADAAGLPAGFEPAGIFEVPPEVQNGTRPRGAGVPFDPAPQGPTDAAAQSPWHKKAELAATGFAVFDLAWRRNDNGADRLTVMPNQIELGLNAAFGDLAKLVVDAQWVFADLEQLEDPPTESLVFDHLFEQAFLELNIDCCGPLPKLTLRAGKFEAPGGGEALDPMDRIPLSRSTSAIRAGPDLLTGIYASLPLFAGLDAFALDLFLVWCNGWDRVITDTAARTFSAGIPHRFWRRDHGWFYEGKLSFTIGVEDENTDDLRWLIDYAVTFRLMTWLATHLELLVGEEAGKGFNPATGFWDRRHPASWSAWVVTVELGDGAFPLSGALRGEYIHDRDLLIGLPREPNLPEGLTSLFGLSATVRYAVVAQDPFRVDLALEYRGEFEKGDVSGVGIHRNFGFDQLHKWYHTQKITLALAGRF